MSKVVVIGAGPAGLMAAGTAAIYGAEVVVIDKNKMVGRKLAITGKGRCNITNACDVNTFISNVVVNNRFLYSAINNFNCDDTVEFFNSMGLKTKVERGNRVFPQSDSAKDVCEALKRFALQNNCKLVFEESVQGLLITDGMIKGVKCRSGNNYNCDAVIIATGGKSYPLTGSTGEGYRLAKQAGHTITDIRPSLVPLVCNNKDCADMQGLSLKNVSVKVIEIQNNKEVYNDFGEMLFTHFGMSGPVILSASAHMRDNFDGKYKVSIDLKPALSYEQLDARILRDFEKNINKDIANSFSELLPRKMITVVLKRWGLPFDIKCNSVTRGDRARLVSMLKGMEFVINGFRPIDEAIITSGGVNVKEINSKTMESKLVKGLFFSGEVIDVDAYTGGFNLQIAYSTGRLAGENAAYI